MSETRPTPPAGSRARRIASRLGLVLLGLTVGALLVEGILRAVNPFGGFLEGEMFWMRIRAFQDTVTIDPDMGFRPRLGLGPFGEHGARINKYDLEKRPGVERVLFIGDSVTFRSRIVRALRKRYGDERYEYWNAGVESFNAVQAMQYYEKFNFRTEPDHVILSFHNNDFQATPVVFRKEGRLVFHMPNRPLKDISEWWFRNSNLYRVLVGLAAPVRGPNEALISHTEATLAAFGDLLRRHDVRFSVILLPIFAPEEKWRPGERRSRREALRILDGQGLRYFDLLETLTGALEDGVIVQEHRGDRWHPSGEAAERFAGFLYDSALLSPEPDPAPQPRETR